MRRHLSHRLPLAILATVVTLSMGAALAQEGGTLVIVTDIVAGHENNQPEFTCIPTNRFSPGRQIIWRTKVIDPATGEEMGADQLEYVRIVMPDGEEFEMEFGPHPSRDPVDEYWTVDWIVPEGYPTGIVDYDVVALAADGRTGRLVMFPIETSMLTIVPE